MDTPQKTKPLECPFDKETAQIPLFSSKEPSLPPILSLHASRPLPRCRPAPPSRSQIHSRSPNRPQPSRKNQYTPIPRPDLRQSRIRHLRSRHRLPDPRLTQRGWPRPTSLPQRENFLPSRTVQPPPSPHHLPRVPLHRLPRSVSNLPLRKKSPPTRFPQHPSHPATHRSLLQVHELNPFPFWGQFRFGVRGRISISSKKAQRIQLMLRYLESSF